MRSGLNLLTLKLLGRWERMNENIVESLKEGLRVFLMAVIPLIIVELQNTGSIVNIQAILIAGLIALLRFTDKLLHKQGRNTGLEFRTLDRLK